MHPLLYLFIWWRFQNLITKKVHRRFLAVHFSMLGLDYFSTQILWECLWLTITRYMPLLGTLKEAVEENVWYSCRPFMSYISMYIGLLSMTVIEPCWALIIGSETFILSMPIGWVGLQSRRYRLHRLHRRQRCVRYLCRRRSNEKICSLRWVLRRM